MRCKIRYLTRQRTGRVAQDEQIVEVEGNRISLGRGTDSTVFLRDLRVNYHHADIVVRDDGIVLEAVGHSILRIDGLPVERGLITPDSEIEVGPYRLQLGQDEADADLTLAVELVTPPPTDTVEQLVPQRGIGLGAGLLGKRASPGCCSSSSSPAVWRCRSWLTGRLEPESPGKQQSGAFPAGFDRFWLSGELSSPHQLLGNDCKACHELRLRPGAQRGVRIVPPATRSTISRSRASPSRASRRLPAPAATASTGARPGSSPQAEPVRGLPSRSERASVADRRSSTPPISAARTRSSGPRSSPIRAAGACERVALGAAGFPEERSNLEFSARDPPDADLRGRGRDRPRATQEGAAGDAAGLPRAAAGAPGPEPGGAGLRRLPPARTRRGQHAPCRGCRSTARCATPIAWSSIRALPSACCRTASPTRSSR